MDLRSLLILCGSWTSGSGADRRSITLTTTGLETRMTDHEAFKSAFRQSCRNIPFWTAAAYGGSFLQSFIGVAGSVISAVFVILFLVFTAQALFTVALSLFLLATYPLRRPIDRQGFQPRWVTASVLLSALDSEIYTGAAYYVGRSAAWWGLL